MKQHVNSLSTSAFTVSYFYSPHYFQEPTQLDFTQLGPVLDIAYSIEVK